MLFDFVFYFKSLLLVNNLLEKWFLIAFLFGCIYKLPNSN